jgi:hypothetical protein
MIDRVFADYAKPDSPGCALAVARDGRILNEKGYGHANLDWDIPVTSATVFNIGSTTKQFVAASITYIAMLHDGAQHPVSRIRNALVAGEARRSYFRFRTQSTICGSRLSAIDSPTETWPLRRPETKNESVYGRLD